MDVANYTKMPQRVGDDIQLKLVKAIPPFDFFILQETGYTCLTYNSSTWCPTPQNLASSSIASSWMTVLSTSKQTASAIRNIAMVSSILECCLQIKKRKRERGHKNMDWMQEWKSNIFMIFSPKVQYYTTGLYAMKVWK